MKNFLSPGVVFFAQCCCLSEVALVGLMSVNKGDTKGLVHFVQHEMYGCDVCRALTAHQQLLDILMTSKDMREKAH